MATEAHPDNPPHIHRADLLAALELMAITDTDNVARVDITPDHVDVTRYDVPCRVDPATDTVVTTTTRIEVR